MDPITLAIVAALAAGVTGGATEVGKKVLVDAYDALKDALKHKLGIDNEAVKAVESLEKKPDSAARRELVKEEIASSGADKDQDIVKAAQALLEHLKAEPSGAKVIDQVARGKNIAQAADNSSASVSVNQNRD